MVPASEITVRVRYNETGRQGIAHHGVFAAWFDMAQMEFLRAKGITYSEIEDRGYQLPQIETHIRFKGAARFDEELKVKMYLRESGAIKHVLDFEVTRLDGSIVATGQTSHAFVDKNMRPVNMKKAWPELFNMLSKSNDKLKMPDGNETAE
ncbi:MAG: acyl-CoA thioesterase [Christensenellales bacterium]|jgi:acyl-CoA thioester hydrolase